MESEIRGSPYTPACKHEVETAREVVSNLEYISVRSGENTFAPSLIAEASRRGEAERGIPGRMDAHTCKRCGRPLDYVDASRTCTHCLEAEAAVAEIGYGRRRI